MQALLAHCAAAFSEHGNLLAVFFIGGLTGGFTHCLAMCGPVVACQSACSSNSCGKRAATGSQIHYHLGRFATYGALGFFAAFLSKHIASLAIWPALSSIMLFLAGVLFILSSMPNCKHSLFKLAGKTGFLRGALMGFMPCGMLYAALMMAATLANPLAGMLAMWLFVLGTLPALMLASASAALITQKWQHSMNNLGRAMMALNGLALLVMATKLVR